MRPVLYTACAALFLFVSPILAAEELWGVAPFTGDPKVMLAAAEAVPAGDADAVVLLQELRYTFDREGHAAVTSRVIYRLIDESAVDDWSTIETEWAQWYQERPVLAARVISRDGGVHKLDADAVTESAAREESEEIFSDNRLLRAPLPGMGAGVVVEEVITWSDRNPLFDTGIAGRAMFGRYVPVQKARLVIDAPSSLPIRFVNKSDPRIEPLKTEADGRQLIVFESARIEALEDLEWNLPYDESSVPYIAFSTGTSWQEVARRYAAIVEKQLGETSVVQPFLRGAIGRSTDRREIVSKALAAIQKNIRYAGVEVGEGSIVPRTPKEVLTLKYGDCKDKATLLVAMLRAAGIPANVALVNAGTDLDIDAALPGLGGFNHVIVHVGGPDPFWVDPTDEYSPAGVLPIQDQDRLALVADMSTTELVRTPASESSANFTRETREFVLAEEGASTLTEITEAVGAYDASIRRYAAEADKKKYRESMEEYAKSAYDAESLKNLVHSDPRDLATPFSLRLEIEKANRGFTGDIDSVVAVYPSNLLDSLPWSLREMPEEEEASKAPQKGRKHDFVLSKPYVKELLYRITPPPGFVARTLPANETRKLGTASLTTQYEVEKDGTIVATLRFDSGKRRLTASEMEATRKAISTLSESNAIMIGFDSVGWSKVNAGEIGGAISEFRRLARLHPKEARHYTQIGRAYFVGGMGEAARDELRRAIALEPDYAPAHKFLGIALQHDLLAREFRKGFDLPGAIAAYRRARELSPKDVEIRAGLAKLLSRGDDGDLYSKGARLTEAIQEYKAIADELEDVSYEGELLTVMAHAGLFEEMKTRAREVEDDTQRVTALVVAAAATEGVEAALREASSVDTTARRAILGAAFPTLLGLRLYSQAAVVIDQAAQGSPNATQVRPLVDMLRRARRFEDLQLGDDPKSFVMRMMVLVGTATDLDAAVAGDVASWMRVFEEELKAQRAKGDTEQDLDRNPFTQARLKTMAKGLPVRVAIELGLGAMDFTQEGSEATGYRVRMRIKSGVPGTPSVSETYYVIKEDGRYVIAAWNHASLAASALHFVDGKDAETARTWLNWAREDISAGGGDDPLSGSPFASLWSKGKATATADEIRAAAAALLVSDSDYAPAAAPRLIAARETVPEANRVRIDLALARSHTRREEWADLVAVTRRIADAWPDSPLAFSLHAAALEESGQSAEAERMAQVRLEKMPQDPAALRALSRTAVRSGDFEAANEYVRRIIDRSDDALSSDYNTLAWNALFIGKAIDQAIEDSNHAVARSGGWPAMHTLAALYAESGKSLEARTKLLESMDLAGREEPSTVDWYVLGRIAENYGATDAALAAYKRVTKPKRNSPGSTYELAQRRVKALGKR